ncbi:MAG: glycosyltransferase family 39 protein, partial [Gammaproteobacteria bacterium]
MIGDSTATHPPDAKTKPLHRIAAILRRNWLPIALATLTAILGAIELGKASIWLDEAVSINLSRVGFADLISEVARKEANMSLYYMLLRMWRVFGSSEVVVRSLSVAAAAATIPILFGLAKRLFGWGVAALAALLLTLNGFFLHYAHEARGYTLVTFL